MSCYSETYELLNFFCLNFLLRDNNFAVVAKQGVQDSHNTLSHDKAIIEVPVLRGVVCKEMLHFFKKKTLSKLP